MHIELVVQVLKIEEVNVEENKKHKVVMDFEVSSYPNKENFNRSIFNKDKNKLLVFGNMADFSLENISENSYLFIKGDIVEASSEENILLADYIEVFRNKRGNLKCRKIKTTN